MNRLQQQSDYRASNPSTSTSSTAPGSNRSQQKRTSKGASGDIRLDYTVVLTQVYMATCFIYNYM